MGLEKIGSARMSESGKALFITIDKETAVKKSVDRIRLTIAKAGLDNVLAGSRDWAGVSLVVPDDKEEADDKGLKSHE